MDDVAFLFGGGPLPIDGLDRIELEIEADWWIPPSNGTVAVDEEEDTRLMGRPTTPPTEPRSMATETASFAAADEEFLLPLP